MSLRRNYTNLGGSLPNRRKDAKLRRGLAQRRRDPIRHDNGQARNAGEPHPPLDRLQWPGTGCQPQPQPPHTWTVPLAGTSCFMLDADGAACPAIEAVNANIPPTINLRARILPPALPVSFHTQEITGRRAPPGLGTKNDTLGCVVINGPFGM